MTTVEWARTLSKVLNEWLRENGYKTKIMLGQELGVGQEEWFNVMRGRSLLGNKAVYAKLYLRTRLKEADPRTIPTRTRKAFGTVIQQSPGWTQEDWQDWINSPEGTSFSEEWPEETSSLESLSSLISKEFVSDPETISMPPFDFSQSLGAVVGTQVDIWINLLAKQLTEQISSNIEVFLERRFEDILKSPQEILASLIREPKVKSVPNDVGSLTQALLDTLQLVVDGKPEDRDRLVSKYGRQLAVLAAMTDILTKPKNERESNLAIFKQRER